MKHYVICENDCLVEGMTAEEITALVQAATGYVPTGDEVAVVSRIINQHNGEGVKIWVGTRVEYNALDEIETDTIYYITDEKTGQEAYNLAVDTKQALENHIALDGYINIYTHKTGALTGSGSNGKFKATVTETLTTIKIGNVSYPVKCGAENEVELTAGAWYTFVFDGASVNFRTGGGLSNSKLAIATATADDVLNGKKFYSGNKTIKTGTMPDKRNSTVQTGSITKDDANNRLLFAISSTGKGYYDTTSKVYGSYNGVRNIIGLTASKIVKGNTILGVTGTGSSGATGKVTPVLNTAVTVTTGFKPSVIVIYGKHGSENNVHVIKYQASNPNKIYFTYGSIHDYEYDFDIYANFELTDTGFVITAKNPTVANQKSYICY